MSAPPFMQLYVADYLGDTRHLTTEQHGAYLLLLMSMWRAGGELVNDPAKLARMTGCTASRWAKISGDVLAFFTDDGAVLTHGRVTAELEKAFQKRDQRTISGSLGGKAKALKNNKVNVAKATVLLKHSSEPEPETEEEPITSNEVIPPLTDKAKGSRLPENWFPRPAIVGDDVLLPPDQWSAELDKFRDYWRAVPGAKGRKLDWDATWRNWLRRASENLLTRKAPNGPDAKLTARHANYARAWEGSERAAG